ncbi:MAG: NAD(P)/FAD-dependent oxidoreductase [Algoriphagus sp.]|nr:NAD(P)/FAD-dependent oxidoreductase [Algoriphagus sp.]
MLNFGGEQLFFAVIIAVIGGGAAGFFAAIHASGPEIQVLLFEKSPKLLSKVKISGGGRCNVTHRPMEISKLVKNYPRGEKFLKKAFAHFSIPSTFSWFESRGVPLKIEEDGRVFPKSNTSQTIVTCLEDEAKKRGVQVQVSTGIKSILPKNQGFVLGTDKGEVVVSKVIIASGGHPNLGAYDYFNLLNHKLIKPIPSLFTFNTPQEPIRSLMGVSMGDAVVKLEGTKLSYRGPILITHWGISGPAVLKLSAFGADWLYEQQYKARAIIQWNADLGEQAYSEQLSHYAQLHPNRKVYSHPLFGVPVRLWEHFCAQAAISEAQLLGQLPKKLQNKLVQCLFCYPISIHGKTTFKEEFVTAGGVSLDEINPETMESRLHPGIYFAGEVLNLDGITGGFNFQAAWTTGFLAGRSAKGD